MRSSLAHGLLSWRPEGVCPVIEVDGRLNLQYLSPFGGPQDDSLCDGPLCGGAELAFPKAEMLSPPVNLKAETKL